MSQRVAVFGAYGHTGRFVVTELRERGFVHMKAHLGCAEPEDEAPRIEAMKRAMAPGGQLMIDLNAGYERDVALRAERLWRPYGLAWIEEPVPPENLPELKRVAERVGIPIAVGERLHTMNEFRPLFDMYAVDVIQPDISHFGGLARTRQLAAWADVYNVLMAPHNVGGPVSTAAALHVAACTPNFMIQEHFNDFADSWVKQAAPGVPEVIDGYFSLPTAPGLGVELNESVFNEHPQIDAHFNLFKEEWHRRDMGKTNENA